MKNRMINILTKEENPMIRFEVLEKFYKIVSTENDINLIIEILINDTDPCVRHEAAAQLFRIEEKKSELFKPLKRKAIDALFDRAYNDISTVVRHESIEALGYLAEKDHLTQLEKLIISEDIDIKSTAAIAYNAASIRIKNNLKANELGDFLLATSLEY